VRFSSLTTRISGSGSDAWLTHYEAAAARARGEDVIVQGLQAVRPGAPVRATPLQSALNQGG